MTANPIVVEQTYRAPIDRVWRAITDPSEMCQWFFEPIRTFRPELAFETRFVVSDGGRDYPHLWKVTEVVSPTKITYDWRYEGYAGAASVEWQLTETTAGTTLRLTHTGWQTFPQDEPAFTRESGLEGWRYFLCERLKAFLENDSRASSELEA